MNQQPQQNLNIIIFLNVGFIAGYCRFGYLIYWQLCVHPFLNTGGSGTSIDMQRSD